MWYLGSQLLTYKEALADWELTSKRLMILVLAIAGYVFALCFLAEAWHWILKVTSKSLAKRNDSYISFLSSQILKYLPVGVFHLAGRHVWLKQRGYSHKALGKAALLETSFMVSISLILGALSGLIFMNSEAVHTLPWWNIGIPITYLLFAGFAAGLALVMAVSWWVFRLNIKSSIREISISAGWVMLFFLLQTSLFMVCYYATGASYPVLVIIPAFLLSWLAGYVVIGSPGGLGVREVVFLFLTNAQISVEYSLLAILLFRLVSVLGEFVAFFLPSGLKIQRKFV